MRDLIPWGRGQDRQPALSYRDEEAHPFLTLHRDMNRLFDDMLARFDAMMPSGTGRSALSWPSLSWSSPSWPRIEVTEADDKLTVAAEIPGVAENDIDVLLDDDVLVIRGEKRSETEDRERQFSERFYGRFERRIPLPWQAEEDKVQASFANGVLTVTLPKSAQAASKAKRIAVNGTAKEVQH